ncbi:MAG: FeoA domain-containing protein [Myxococcales bacterium]|nr:FeoA domain-containing protein [Myxococcales bacterium]
MHPGLLITVGLVVIALPLLLFFRPWGLYWRLRRALRSDERVLVEDALKHLYSAEASEQSCTLDSLAGTLSIGRGRAAQVAGRLLALGLVEQERSCYVLTATGRSEALRVIRSHRLYERYLSDHTGVPPERWHELADEVEHQLADRGVEQLADFLAQPAFDPHGDPIPSADGELPELKSIPLSELPVDVRAEIVHVEDEPQAVYEQLLAEGLALGMMVEVFHRDAREIRCEADGREYRLAPVVAANISVLPYEGPRQAVDEVRLADLELGEQARVTGIAPSCSGLPRRRLLDLGFVPGARVVAELCAPGGEPTAYRVCGALLALRRDQAEQVAVERVRAAPPQPQPQSQRAGARS